MPNQPTGTVIAGFFDEETRTLTAHQGALWDQVSAQVYGTTDYMSFVKDNNLQYYNVAAFGGGEQIYCPIAQQATPVAGMPPWVTTVAISGTPSQLT